MLRRQEIFLITPRWKAVYILLHGSFSINVSDVHVGVAQPRTILWSRDDSTPVSLVITSTTRGMNVWKNIKDTSTGSVQRRMRHILFEDSRLKILQPSCCCTRLQAVACNVICMGENKFAYRLIGEGRTCNLTRC